MRNIQRGIQTSNIYPGSQDQLPDPLMEAIEGQGLVPAYRGTAYVVIENLALADFGNRVPQLSFEVVRPEQAGQEFTHWKSWVGLNFTWLYIGAQVRKRPDFRCDISVSSVWIKSVLAGRVGLVRWLPLLQQVRQHPARTGGLPTGIQ